MNRLLAWLNRKFNLVATPEESAYLGWADLRLDHIAEHANLRKRGYRLHCNRPDCDIDVDPLTSLRMGKMVEPSDELTVGEQMEIFGK